MTPSCLVAARVLATQGAWLLCTASCFPTYNHLHLMEALDGSVDTPCTRFSGFYS